MSNFKKEDTSLTQSDTFRDRKAARLFAPISRPFLKTIPEPAVATRFLKAFEIYSHELAHRRANHEDGTQELEPMHFCIHQNVLDWLISCKELTLDPHTKLISDAQLTEWLESIIVEEKLRPLPEILRGLQWPSAGSSFVHQTQLFQMNTLVLLRDAARAHDLHDEKSVITILGSRLPRPLKLAARTWLLVASAAPRPERV